MKKKQSAFIIREDESVWPEWDCNTINSFIKIPLHYWYYTLSMFSLQVVLVICCLAYYGSVKFITDLELEWIIQQLNVQ